MQKLSPVVPPGMHKHTGGTAWRDSTQEEGCTGHSVIHYRNCQLCLASALLSLAGTKTAVDGAKGVGGSIRNASETLANVGRPASAAGYASPAVGVFVAAGFGSLLLLAL
jgi:hypothetical protein